MRELLGASQAYLDSLVDHVDSAMGSPHEDKMEGLRVHFQQVVGELCAAWHAAQMSDEEYDSHTQEQFERVRLRVPKFHMDLLLEEYYWQDPLEGLGDQD